MFFASLAMHVILLAAIMISVPGSTRQLTFGPSYTVALVGPEVIASPQNLPALRDMMHPALSDRPVILKRDTHLSTKVPIVKQDDSGRQDIEKAIASLRQKDAASMDRDSTNKFPSGPPTPSPDQAKINDYSRFIWNKIKKNWVLPPSLMPKENITAIIEVRIGANGALEHVAFEKKSGNRYFDESALRAVTKSAPFPPLSGWGTGRSIDIGIRFHSAELR
jgi:TonB family protein